MFVTETACHPCPDAPCTLCTSYPDALVPWQGPASYRRLTPLADMNGTGSVEAPLTRVSKCR